MAARSLESQLTLIRLALQDWKVPDYRKAGTEYLDKPFGRIQLRRL